MLKSFTFPRSLLSSVLFCYLQHSTKKKKGKLSLSRMLLGQHCIHCYFFLSSQPHRYK